MQQVQSRLSAVTREIAELRKENVSALLEELAALHGTRILQGDYDLKIARQDYFTSKQDQVREGEGERERERGREGERERERERKEPDPEEMLYLVMNILDLSSKLIQEDQATETTKPTPLPPRVNKVVLTSSLSKLKSTLATGGRAGYSPGGFDGLVNEHTCMSEKLNVENEIF